MASFNKVILAGNLTRDPQLSYLPSGTPVCEIGLAINHRYRTQDGQQREEVCFIDCRCFGRQAEVLNQYMGRGRSLLVEGRLDFDQWESPDGKKQSRHRVFIEKFTFLGGQGQGGGQGGSGGYSQQGGGNYGNRGGGGNYGGGNQNGYGNQQPPAQQQQPPAGGGFGPPDDMGEEDIPF